MGVTLVFIFLGVFALAIGQAVIRRKLNPYRDVGWHELPAEMRTELERVLPGFQPGPARLTKNGDEARAEGTYQGEPIWVEGEFDASGQMIELEAETHRGTRVRAMSSNEEVPASIMGEMRRVLGDAAERFQSRTVLRGTSGDTPFFKVKGLVDGWKWEIAVTTSGQLLEFEKERRRG